MTVDTQSHRDTVAVMPFVKLDCGILNSTLWFEKEARDIFITALLMAEPRELLYPQHQINVRDLEDSGWMVPPGWYGMVEAAGVGIIHRAGIEQEIGLKALELLGSPEPDSRSPDFDGRRMVRVDGGYIILNFMKYRERDYTSAERSKRYRDNLKKRHAVAPSNHAVTDCDSHVTVTNPSASASASALPPKGECEGELPDNLKSNPLFLAAWADWMAHRKEIKRKPTPTATKLQLQKLSAIGPEKSVIAINHSIANGWTGIFEPEERKTYGNRNNQAPKINRRNALMCKPVKWSDTQPKL